MKVQVEMTIEDLVDGRRFDPCRCPVALATRRAIPDRPVNVYGDAIIIGGDEVRLPVVVQDFVARFDDDLGPDPISFEIEVSDSEAVL